MILRPATGRDVTLLYEWRNRPDWVALSGTGSDVTWPEHLTWYAYQLQADTLRIVEHEGQPIGFVRAGTGNFGLPEDISIGLLPEYTGRGFGSQVLAMFLRERRGARYRALIRGDNSASARCFEKAGFRRTQTIWEYP